MLSVLAQPARCWAAQPAQSRRIPRLLAPVRRWQPPAPSSQAGGGGGGPTGDPTRKLVFLKLPDRTLRLEDLTQGTLDRVLAEQGAVGFLTADGTGSWQLGDLPEGGSVRVVLKEDLLKMILQAQRQVDNMQRSMDISRRGREQELARFIRSLASAEHGGHVPVTLLQEAPFKYPDGRPYVRLPAAVIARGTLYVGHYQQKLNEGGVCDVVRTLQKLRLRNASPELDLALQGVTAVRLFLCGEAVRPGLKLEALVEQAAAEGISVVLPTGRPRLGPAGADAPALPM